MKPCSVYCKPKEGVHVYLDYWSVDDFEVSEHVFADPHYTGVGHLYCTGPGRFREIVAAPAPEAPPAPPEVAARGFVHPRLVTVQRV